MCALKAVNSENLDELYQALAHLPSEPEKRKGDGGGSDGYNGNMEARVKSLEEAVKNLPTKADMTELRLSTQADASNLRADSEKFRTDSIKSSGDLRGEFEKFRGEVGKGFTELRADMHKNSIDIQRWMIATVIGLFLGFGGLFLAMSNALKQPTSVPQAALQSTQPPIIINVPAAQPAPTSATATLPPQ